MTPSSMFRLRVGRRGLLPAFTLIELLVVISIITVLISILLPQLSGARRLAQRLVCSTKLRSIAQGAGEYAQQHEDAIIGAPVTSGVYLQGVTGSAYAGPCVTRWDFMGPMAHLWGYREPMFEDPAARFNFIRSMKEYTCPTNVFIANYFDGIDAGPGPMIAMNTSRNFLFNGIPDLDNPSGEVGMEINNPGFEEELPGTYGPRISRVGDASKKIYVGDGSRYATINVAPDYDLRPDASWGGTHSDLAPYSKFSRSWDRSGAPGNDAAGIVCSGLGDVTDARQYSYRHAGATVPCGAEANAYKGTFVFFDGHVETLGDLESSNPYMWLPAGSKLRPDNSQNDTLAAFGAGVLRIGS